jgi:hypothetical protein
MTFCQSKRVDRCCVVSESFYPLKKDKGQKVDRGDDLPRLLIPCLWLPQEADTEGQLAVL